MNKVISDKKFWSRAGQRRYTERDSQSRCYGRERRLCDLSTKPTMVSTPYVVLTNQTDGKSHSYRTERFLQHFFSSCPSYNICRNVGCVAGCGSSLTELLTYTDAGAPKFVWGQKSHWRGWTSLWSTGRRCVWTSPRGHLHLKVFLDPSSEGTDQDYLFDSCRTHRLSFLFKSLTESFHLMSPCV